MVVDDDLVLVDDDDLVFIMDVELKREVKYAARFRTAAPAGAAAHSIKTDVYELVRSTRAPAMGGPDKAPAPVTSKR